MRIALLFLSLVAFGFTGCSPASSDSTDDTSTGGGGTTPKALLSSWSVKPSGAWAARLDLTGVNTSGTPFTLVYKFSDTTETTCTATMTGTDSSGTFSTTGCTAAGGGMSASTGASPFATGGAGTYTNTGATLSLCKANTSCLDYQ